MFHIYFEMFLFIYCNFCLWDLISGSISGFPILNLLVFFLNFQLFSCIYIFLYAVRLILFFILVSLPFSSYCLMLNFFGF